MMRYISVVYNACQSKLAAKFGRPVNMYRCNEQFEASWPDSFYEPLSNKVVTMSISKKRIKLESKDCYDTDLIYSRVMGLMNSRDVE